MEGLVIQISWVYFLGIMGSLILIAWKVNGRFTTLETNYIWIEKILKNIKVSFDNEEVKAFQSKSPIALTDKGVQLLNKSGIKEYIDSKDSKLIIDCSVKKSTNSYEVQKYIFDLFDNITFDNEFDNKMKKFAFDQGVSTDIIRRIGAIYFRDICLKEFKMQIEDIDTHNPKHSD